MDRPHNGVLGRTSNISTGRMSEARSDRGQSTAARPPALMQPAASRLQKKRSNAGDRSTVPGPYTSSPYPAAATPKTFSPATAGPGQSGRARTGSIRSAMRKIFGRRSRDVDLAEREPVRASPPRHQHHRSESSALAPTLEALEPETAPPLVPPLAPTRAAASEAYNPMPAYASKRIGSPYAMQFPKSAQLKPLDLGNPFAAPRNQLRRRKTLPNILPGDIDSDNAPRSAPISTEPFPVPPLPSDIDLLASDARRPFSRERQLRNARRRSRSVEDMRQSPGKDTPMIRKRSEEIRYWRDSVQGDMRQTDVASRPMIIGEAIGEREEDNQPMPELNMPERSDEKSATYQDSPQRASMPAVGEPELEPDTPGTEMAKDLEDRVARLEAGLRTFQRSLQRLTADRNRRTFIMGNFAARRSSEDVRTPSMLADTLLELGEPATHQPTGEPAAMQRPATAPRSETPTRSDDPFTVDFPPLPPSTHPPESIRSFFPLPAASPSEQGHSRSGSTDDPNATAAAAPTYTFRSLYQMLSNERSARRRLETEVRSLREEMSDLHSQVASTSSNVHSARSSSYMPADPAAGSMRLREMLRETETQPSPPSRQQASIIASSSPSRWSQRVSGISTAQAQQQQQQQQQQQPVTSRFSASESDVSDAAELPTPHDAYQTPAEEQSRWHVGADGEDDEEIF